MISIEHSDLVQRLRPFGRGGKRQVRVLKLLNLAADSCTAPETAIQ